MGDEEKLSALKKAYADVILNISKEAASRVIALEKKALRLQPELKMVKDESLRMMMRLKQMMDFKINEEVAASLNQQHKIGELEAQLHEAEDIVRDLREELAQAQSELRRLKKENLRRANGPKPVEDPYQSHERHHPEFKFQSTPDFDLTVPYLNHRHESGKCHDHMDCACNPRVRDHYLPSIISRGKEPSLFSSGRTLRIHACEEKDAPCNVISIPGKSDKMKDENNVDLVTSKVEELKKDLSPSKEETKSGEVLSSAGHVKSDTDYGVVRLHGSEDSSNIQLLSFRSASERVFRYTYQRKRKRQTKEGSQAQASLGTETSETGDNKDSDKKSEQVVESTLLKESS